MKRVAGTPCAWENMGKEAAWCSVVGMMVAPDDGTDTTKIEFLLMLLLGMCNLVILWGFNHDACYLLVG